MKKVIMMFLTFSLVIGLFAGCGNNESDNTKGTDATTNENGENTGEETANTDPEGFDDQVVFTVGDHDIMLSRVNLLLFDLRQQYEGMYGPGVWDMQFDENSTVEEMVKENIKKNILSTAVMLDKAQEEGIEITDEEKKTNKENASSIFNSLQQTDIDKYGISLATVEEVMNDQTIVRKLYEELTSDFEYDEEKVNSDLEANPQYQEIMKYGVDHYADKVRARHILIKTSDENGQPLSEEAKAEARAKIEDLLEQAKEGADFAQLATDNTEDPGSKDNGGEYTFGRGDMVPEFEAAAYSLEEGEISDVVETSHGYHIIKLEEKIPASEEDVTKTQDNLDSIRQSLIDQQRMAEFERISQEYLDANYTVEVNEELWDSITVSDQEEAEDASVEEPATDEATTQDATTEDTTDGADAEATDQSANEANNEGSTDSNSAADEAADSTEAPAQ